MRILIATGLYPPDIGGPATYAKMLYEELPRRGVAICIVWFGRVRFLPFGIRHVAYFLWLLWEARGAAVIYAQDAVSVGIPAALASLFLRRPLWVRIPGDYAWEQGVQRFGVTDTLDVFIRTSSYAWPVRTLRRVQTWVMRRAERVIVPSRYMAGVVAAGNVPQDKICIIYSSVVRPQVGRPKEELRRRLELSGQVIVSAGRLVPWKGFEGLISAFAALRREFPGALLVVVGEGPLLSELKRHAEKRGVADSVRFTGRLPQEELFAYIQAADVFALNTAYEGLSHQLVEVMMLNTPIVTTSAGGNPELIEDRENGLLVPYNDVEALSSALEALLRDSAFARALSKCAKERSELFIPVRSLEQFCELLRRDGHLRERRASPHI